MSNVHQLPPYSGTVYDGIYGEVPLAARQPRRQIVGTARRGDQKRERVRAGFQSLAISAVKNGWGGHTDAHSKTRSERCWLKLLTNGAETVDKRPQREDKLPQCLRIPA